MALKNVVIGYAKGDKGDKGDTGERGTTGQTGPQGEPGNIADAAITDTQGLDVAKGAKTTAQKLFDAIADRIVNKLVTNDTLTTKLADYLLKSAMSSTNIDSTTNVPTSALVYSLMQDVNNNLSKKADSTSLSNYALKSDLFGELCTNPNTLTALVAMVNGYDSNVTNIPDAAKKKFSIILNVWASPLGYLGDLTKTHMQVLIIGSSGGVFTRKYESNAWSNWQ